MLFVVVAGSGRSLVLVESEQGEERKERFCMTQQDGGRLRRLLRGPEQRQRKGQPAPLQIKSLND